MTVRGAAIVALMLVLPAVIPDARAFSIGSPICEVNQLPLVEMSPTLSLPPPTGWTIVAIPQSFVLGGSLSLQVRNVDPARRARGILIWVKSGSTTGYGQFTVPASGLFQDVPAACSAWTLTHTSGVPKDQSELRFDWTAPMSAPGGAVIARAYLIEDCVPDPESGCRTYQALTPVLVLPEALFFDGFES